MYCVCTFTSIHHRAYTCWHLTNNPARWYIKFSLIQTVWRSAVWFSKLSSLHFYASFITFLFCTFENAAQHWLIVLRGLNKLNKWNHFEIQFSNVTKPYSDFYTTARNEFSRLDSAIENFRTWCRSTFKAISPNDWCQYTRTDLSNKRIQGYMYNVKEFEGKQVPAVV